MEIERAHVEGQDHLPPILERHNEVDPNVLYPFHRCLLKNPSYTYLEGLARELDVKDA
jgi:hypothetical protein